MGTELFVVIALDGHWLTRRSPFTTALRTLWSGRLWHSPTIPSTRRWFAQGLRAKEAIQVRPREQIELAVQCVASAVAPESRSGSAPASPMGP